MSLLLVALRSLSVTKQHPFSRYRHASNVAPAFGPASQPTLHRAGIRTVANGASGAGGSGTPGGCPVTIVRETRSRTVGEPRVCGTLGVTRLVYAPMSTGAPPQPDEACLLVAR